ncbi:MAG: GNAT family protein [Pseudomonadota bacterium]
MSDKIFEKFPEIKLDDGIILRQILPDIDYLYFYNYITDPKVTAYLAPEDIPSNQESAKFELGYWARLFDRHNSFYWAIVVERANRIIGTCGFNFWNRSQKRVEISYDLDHNYWGKSITTNAVKAISDFAFMQMEAQRIQATVAIDNIPSIRVLEKSNFKKEGVLEKYGFLNNQPRDFYMYAICR